MSASPTLMFHVKHARWMLAALLAVLIAAMPLGGCASTEESLVTGTKRAYGYSWEQERQIGEESDAQIIAQYGIYDDEDLAAYVDSLGQVMVSESHIRREGVDPKFRETPFVFRVMDSPVVNAFALPGGYIYVTRGLLSHLDNEAQLAVVLGHEVGHVVGRHASVRAVNQQLGQIGLFGAAILGQEVLGGNAAEGILNLGGTAAQLLFLSWGRDDERESDRLGVEYAALAGYEAAEGAEFFRSLERISEQAGASLPTWQSTHPDPGEREERIRERAANWEEQVEMTKEQRDNYLRHIEGMVLGENPRQGFVRNGMFYHPDLQFQFDVPDGFQVINQATQVVMVDQNQQAYMVLSIADQRSADAAAAAFAQQQGLSNVQQGSARPGGLTAQVVQAEAQMQGGQQVSVLNYFIEYGGNVYSILGLSSSQQFSTYGRLFERTSSSFARLTDTSILNIQPTYLGVVTVQQATPFRSLVPASLPDGLTAEELAIINQVELDDTIPRGAQVKLPR